MNIIEGHATSAINVHVPILHEPGEHWHLQKSVDIWSTVSSLFPHEPVSKQKQQSNFVYLDWMT